MPGFPSLMSLRNRSTREGYGPIVSFGVTTQPPVDVSPPASSWCSWRWVSSVILRRTPWPVRRSSRQAVRAPLVCPFFCHGSASSLLWADGGASEVPQPTATNCSVIGGRSALDVHFSRLPFRQSGRCRHTFFTIHSYASEIFVGTFFASPACACLEAPAARVRRAAVERERAGVGPCEHWKGLSCVTSLLPRWPL